jgi:hypothetical protein
MIGIKSFTGPVNKAVNQVGNAANQVYKAIVPDKVENAINTSIGGDSAVGKVVDKTGQVVQKQVTAVTASTLATAKAFVKKPLPYIATVGLSQFLPYSLATSLVTAVRTGDFKPIVIDMGMNYASMGLNEFLGQDKNSIYGKVLTGMSLPALRTALGGGTQEQIGNAAVAGGAGAYVTTILTTPKDKGGYGLKPEDITHKMVTNATTAATRAILNGKSVGDAVVESALVTGGSLAVGKAYENLTKNSETLQTVQQKFDEAKQKVKDIWEGKPNLASDHEKMVLAGQAAKNAADHAMLANSFAKKLSQDYVDGKTFDTDAVDRAQKYAEDLYDSAIRHSQDYDEARGKYEGEAIASGYADAETAFDQASFDVRVADTALLDSQKEFSSAYQDYDDTVNIVESFTNSDIAKIAAENINSEVMQAREQLMQADEALGEGPEQFKTQEEFEAETNPQATTTPQQQAEQDALVKASQAYTQTPAERIQDEANLFQEKHLEEERKKAEAYAEAEAKLTNQEKWARDNPEAAYNQRINEENAQREEASRLAAEEREAERARILDATGPANWREQEAEAKIQAERWKDPILKAQDIQAMRESEQEAQVKAAQEAARVAEENRIAQREATLDAANPNWREQERLAAEQAALFAKYPWMRAEFNAEQDRKREAEERQKRIDEETANLEIARENQKLIDAERKQREEQAAKDAAEAKAAEDKRVSDFFANLAKQEAEEAFNKSPEGIRQAAEKQAKEKADLDEQHKAEVLAREKQAKEKADADALAQHNAQVKAAEDAKVAASKTATQAPITQTPVTTEPKQTQIGATISQVGTASFNAAIAQKIAEEKAARAREEALAKQEALKAEALAKQAAAREKAKADYEEKVRIQQEFQARAKAEAQAKAKADYDAKVKAQLEAKAAADAKAKADYDEKVRLKAEYDAKVKADQEARAAAYAKAKAEYDAKAKADYDARVKAQADAKAAYDEKVRLKAEYDAKVKAQADAKAKAEAFAKAQADIKAAAAAKAKAESDAIAAAENTGTEPPVISTTGGLPTVAPTGTLTPVTKPTGTLTPVTAPTGTLTPVTKTATPTGGLTPVTKPTTSVPPTGGLTAVTKPVTTTPVTSLPTTSTSTTIAKPTGTLTPVTKPPTGGLTPVVKPPTGTLTPVTKPTGTLTPVTKPTGALTSVVKPTGTLTPV